MPLAPIRLLAIILPVMATGLGGCSAIVADLVILPFRVVGEAVEYAMEDDGSDSSDGSDEAGETRITGYCHDPSQGMAYPLHSASPDVSECAPGVQSISKAEYDKFVATQARAYCAKAISGWLYRMSSETCASGDETLTKSDYEARARVYPLRAAM